MRQHLDTIPIWDAYKEGSECPMCSIRAHNEEMYVDNFLGGSVMEPAVRIQVNQKGFCSAHFKMLYDKKNRLGLALMGHTYLKETIQKLSDHAAQPDGQAGRSLFGRKQAAQDAAKPVRDIAEGCILCERLGDTMYRYALTLCYMWKHEPEFQRAFAASKGFCLPHYADVLKAAQEELHGAELGRFNRELAQLELANLERIEKEIEWFTLKFDYRNQDKPWGTSQDAVERTVNKLRGKSV